MCTTFKVHVNCAFQGPQGWKSLTALCEVTDILVIFSNRVLNTQAMPVFQFLNLIHVTLGNPRCFK